MWGNRSLLRRIGNLEKRLPDTNDDAKIIIELRREAEGGTRIWKVINGERVPGSQSDLKIKPNQKVDFKVKMVRDDEL